MIHSYVTRISYSRTRGWNVAFLGGEERREGENFEIEKRSVGRQSGEVQGIPIEENLLERMDSRDRLETLIL